jgi:hypothetical protein
LGQRSRKRRAAPSPAAPTPEAVRRGYARARERDDEARAKLRPLAPGERPLAVTLSAILAGGIAVANLGLYLAGWDVRGQEPNLGGTLALCALLAATAIGMWRLRYWAVLGFEVLLGVSLVFAALSLLVASNLEAAIRAVAVVLVVAPLFWALIRVMARIQMPRRDTPESTAR